MGIDTAPGTLTTAEIVALSREHTLYEWSAQRAVDPIPVDRAEGVYFYTPDGKRYPRLQQPADVGEHRPWRPARHRRDHRAGRQAAYANPFMATEPRGRLGEKLAEILPGDIDVFFFTNGGAEANENAIKLARQFTGRQKIMTRYRSYHGATGQVMVATGDPRRWAAETGVSGIVAFPDSHRWGRKDPEPVEREPARPRGGHHVRGAADDRGHHPRDRSSAPTASSSRPTATCRASGRCATSTASCSSPTRSWPASGGPAVVRGRPLGRGARTSSRWPRASPRRTCRWARWACAARSPTPSRTRCSTAA